MGKTQTKKGRDLEHLKYFSYLQFSGENTAHHSGPLREVPVLIMRKGVGRELLGRCLCCVFIERKRQGRVSRFRKPTEV